MKIPKMLEEHTNHIMSQSSVYCPCVSPRAATNDYFDNRLVGRLIFRFNLINSAHCPSNKLNAMKTYSA